jgi:hypothetical protein
MGRMRLSVEDGMHDDDDDASTTTTSPTVSTDSDGFIFALKDSDDDSDDERRSLLDGVEKGHDSNMKQADSTNDGIMHVRRDKAVGISFSIQLVALLVLILLTTSQLFLFHQCRLSRAVRNVFLYKQTELDDVVAKSSNLVPILRKYRLDTKNRKKTIWSSTSKSTTLYKLQPGEEIIVEESIEPISINAPTTSNTFLFEYEPMLRVLHPKLGFVEQEIKRRGQVNQTDSRQPLFFVPLPEKEQPEIGEFSTNSFCPLLYSGWETRIRRRRTMFAPVGLVWAQQIWNGMQVVLLILTILINYEFSLRSTISPDNDLHKRKSSIQNSSWSILSSPSFQRWYIRFLTLSTLVTLPFSVYISSPGGHLFSLFTAFWIILAFTVPKSVLRLSIGEKDAIEEASIEYASPCRLICFEETFGMLCCLGSSVYNYAGPHGSKAWPYWMYQFRKIDDYMDWPPKQEVIEDNWTMMGVFQERAILPPFVPRAGSSSTIGSQMFWIIWSVLPFLYCCYFSCMLILSQKSKTKFAKWFQRAACIFGICHFLFGTDGVHYAYGRGYRNPHSEFFHWTEKWSFRCAILIPIWQGCTSGHWKYGYKYCSFIGQIVHYSMIVYAFGFLTFQVLQSDLVNTFQYTFDYDTTSIIQSYGLYNNQHPVWKILAYPYHQTLMHMWIFYGLTHVTCFNLYHITLQKQNVRVTNNDKAGEEEAEETSLLGKRKGL